MIPCELDRMSAPLSDYDSYSMSIFGGWRNRRRHVVPQEGCNHRHEGLVADRNAVKIYYRHSPGRLQRRRCAPATALAKAKPSDLLFIYRGVQRWLARDPLSTKRPATGVMKFVRIVQHVVSAFRLSRSSRTSTGCVLLFGGYF